MTARTQASQPGRHRHCADGSAFGSSSEAAFMSLFITDEDMASMGHPSAWAAPSWSSRARHASSCGEFPGCGRQVRDPSSQATRRTDPACTRPIGACSPRYGALGCTRAPRLPAIFRPFGRGASWRCMTFPRIGSRWHPPVGNLPAHITREVWGRIDSTMVSVDTLVSAKARQCAASRIEIELAHGDHSRCGTARRRRSSVRGQTIA